MRRILFVGALGTLVALPSALAYGPRGGGGGRPAPQQASQHSAPTFARPNPQPMARPNFSANRGSFGQGQAAAQHPSFAGARPSPGGLNHAAPSPSVIRPGGQAGARQPINHALPAGPSPSVIRPGVGGGGSVIRPGAGGGGTQYRPAQGSVIRPGAGGSGTQLRPDRPTILPSRPGQGGSGTQLRPDVRPGQGGGGQQLLPARPSTLPSRPGQGGGGEQWRPGRPNIGPNRPGQGGSGTLLPPDGRPDRPNLRPDRPGQGGGGEQWRPDRPGFRPDRPGQGGGGEQWRPNRPDRPGQGGGGEQWRPDRPIRPNRPIINNGTANIGNRVISNNVNNVNVNQWNQYSQNVVAGGGYNRPWYGTPGYWNQPFYGGLSAAYWSRPWNNYHYGWLSGYSSGAFAAVPTFWAGTTAATAFDASPTFAYSNPYFAAPPAGDTNVNVQIQGLDYAQPIPAPTIEQTVIAFPPAPDQADVQAGEPLPTTPPPAPPQDDTATSANKLFDSARASFKDGKYPDAQTQVEQAIAKLPSDAALHEFRSLTLFAQGKYKDAAGGLYAVLAAGPGWNWQTVTSLYADPAEYTKQLRALEQYVKDHPDAGDGHFLLAYQYLVLGSKNDAVSQFKEVTRVQPDDKLSAELLNALTTTPKEVAAGSGR
jgi:Tetratricopeptide repeat